MNSSHNPAHLVGVGLCALDHLCLVEKFPGPDQKIEAIEFSLQGGGPVPTALCAFSKLGGKSSFIGKCGNDYQGQTVRSELDKFGVCTRSMIYDKNCRTPNAFIWVDSRSGDRTVVLDRSDISDLTADELDENLISSCDYLLLDGREEKAALKSAQIARNSGAEVILDAGSPRKNIEQLFPLIDHLVVSKTFVQRYMHEHDPLLGVRILARRGFKSVVITLGDKGCACAAKDDIFTQPAFRVKSLDTTGAGDVFHGAYIFGLSQGWQSRKIVEFASAAASLKCRHLGGRKGIAAHAEIDKFLSEQLPAA